MSNSDIFNEYVKISLEKGLISEAKDDAKKILEKTRRADSQSISDIAALYGVEPNQADGQEYEKNIAEVAHPNASVVSPSHDKLNGTVWDINRKQNILLNIVNKPVNGLLTHHKYAREELLKSLIRTANHMDNLDREELRVLADDCIDGLTKESGSSFFDKLKGWLEETGEDVADVGTGAVIGGAVGGLIGLLGGPFGVSAGIYGGAAVGGAISAIFATGPEAKNVHYNAEQAQLQLQDIITDYPDDDLLVKYSEQLESIKDSALKYDAVVSKAQADSVKMQEDPESADFDFEADKKETQEIGKKYLQDLININKTILIFLLEIKRGKYTSEDSPIWSKVKKPFTALFGSDIHDAERSAEQLKREVDKAIKTINEINQQLKSTEFKKVSLTDKDKKLSPPSDESVKVEEGDTAESGDKALQGLNLQNLSKMFQGQ